MDTADLALLVEHLEDSFDELEENLEPLLSATLAATTKKLPLLDKAKLYVLIVYSIESLLFSYLRLNGIKAKDHPVFKELTRVKQYFEKIKVAEEDPAKLRQNLSLNKEAVGRVIKHALAGNDKHDLERAEREAKEKLMAKRKLQAVEQKKAPQANHNVDNVEEHSAESSDEANNGEVEESNSTPLLSEPQAGQPSNIDGVTGKKNESKKRKPSKAERRAKRERGQQDPGGQKTKRRKTAKNKKKQDHSPPADR